MIKSEQLIKQDEGTKKKNGKHIPYKCSAGILTIGYGRNLEKGISDQAAEFLFQEDMAEVRGQCVKFPWFRDLTEARQAVIENMVFNLGLGTFLEFKNTIALIENKKYEEASTNMLKSKWATQVGPRAERLALMMKTGEFNE